MSRERRARFARWRDGDRKDHCLPASRGLKGPKAAYSQLQPAYGDIGLSRRLPAESKSAGDRDKAEGGHYRPYAHNIDQ